MIERAQMASQSMIGLIAQSGDGERYWYGRTWQIPWPWIVLLAIGCAVFVFLVYRRERECRARGLKVMLALLRVSIILVVILAMQGWIRYGAKTDLPDLVIAIDVSRSMSHQDRSLSRRDQDPAVGSTQVPTRLQQVVEHLVESDPDRFEALSERYNIKVYAVSNQLSQLDTSRGVLQPISDLSASGDSSRLGTAVEEIIHRQRGRPTAAIVLWSDGVTTDGMSLREAAIPSRQRNIPLILVGVGDEEPPSDFRVSDLRVDDVVFIDDLVTFEFQLTAVGMAGREATVLLTRQGDTIRLDEERIGIATDDESHTVRLMHRPADEGEFDYVVQVEIDDAESDTSNNQLIKRIEVRDETIRVLLVQDRPSYEFRFLKQLLSRRTGRADGTTNRSIELTTIQQDASFEYADVDEDAEAIFPVRQEELFGYDVVILGDVRPEHAGRQAGGLGQVDQQNLHDFVYERGGGLILICGPNHLPSEYRDTPLEALFAFRFNSFQVPDNNDNLIDPHPIVPTVLGLGHPPMMIGESPDSSSELFQSFEGPYWIAQVGALKPGALTLAETPRRQSGRAGQSWPMITLQRVGPGKVLTHYFEESYRWRARTGDLYFERYWVQAIRYLSRQKLLGAGRRVELTAERIEFRSGEPIRLVARFFEPQQIPSTGAIVAAVVDTEGRRTTVNLQQEVDSPDRFTGTIRNLPPGYYVASLPAQQGEPPASDDFTVREPEGELQRLEMNATEMTQAAEISRGQFFRFADAEQMWREIPPGQEVDVSALPPVSVWNLTWPLVIVAVLLLSLLSLEWILRKRIGMI